MKDEIQFTFTYQALKLLGKSLYSNLFSALSELIANGFDAGAKNVYVYLDASNRNNATIEILDDGLGMGEGDLTDKYAKIGSDNRSQADQKMMGRKGIGKLAAFFLSDLYYIATKKSDGPLLIYEADFQHITASEASKNPTLQHVSDISDFRNKQLFSTFASGSSIVMKGVNLKGYSYETLEAFGATLAEMFNFEKDILPSSNCSCSQNSRKINWCLIKDCENKDGFHSVARKIGFGNMLKIFSINSPELLKQLKSRNCKKINTDFQYDGVSLQQEIDEYKPGTADLKSAIRDLDICGWVGIHSTMKRELATKNDPNFERTKFFRPFRIRLYVRGKKVIDDLKQYISSAQFTFSYLEGDIFCDSLDANDEPDIISTNRESIDMNDDRAVKLVSVISNIARNLSEFWSNKAESAKKSHLKKQQLAMQKVVSDIENNLSENKNKPVTDNDIKAISREVYSSFKTNEQYLDMKTEYRLFLSHASKQKEFSDFIYYYLIKVKRFPKDWIFYTSKDGGQPQLIDNLSNLVLSCIYDKKCLCAFSLTDEFFKSQYALFEGGAVWAVRNNDKICLAYDGDFREKVPGYMQSMKNISVRYSYSKLDRVTYSYLVSLLNFVIDYLNNNFESEGDKKPLLSDDLPDEVALKEQSKNIEKFFDLDVVKYWDAYITNKSNCGSSEEKSSEN